MHHMVLRQQLFLERTCGLGVVFVSGELRLIRTGTIVGVLDRNVTVLIVEDEMLVALDIQQTLKLNGLEPLKIASNVRDALAEIQQNKPDFALLDYNLTGETSVEVAQKLVEEKIPFYYLTGDLRSVADDLLAPDALIFTKPVNIEEVVALIRANICQAQ